MRIKKILFRNTTMGFVLLALLTFPVTARNDSAKEKPEKAAGTVENFRLLDHQGKSHELYRQTQAPVVVLVVAGNGCPIVRQSIATIKALRDRFADKKVVFWLLDPNSQDDQASSVEEAKEFSIDLPILMDKNQLVARSLTANRTAEAIAISTKDWKIFYRGAIDDRLGYGTQKVKPPKTYLANALENFLAGKKVSPSTTPVKGCAVSFVTITPKEGKTVSYAKEVAPILQKHCVTCHSHGNIGPFAMSSYEKVKGWSSTIQEVLLEQRMPPWHADPHHGAFANDRSLSSEEIQTLVTWIDQGKPRGAGNDPLAAQPSKTTEEWALGKPDYIVQIPKEVTVEATGVFPYRYMIVKSPIPEDAWLSAAVVRASNRKVLHHCLVFVKYPKDAEHPQPDNKGGIDGFFTGYVPGTEQTTFPEGTGKFLPKGALFIFQLHYTATGKEEKDQTEIGLYLSKTKPPMELQTRAAAQTRLDIPPGDPNYEVQGSFTFQRDSLLYEMSPHMHFRGARCLYEAVYPDGKRERLLSVPNYDFNWQTTYRLAEPKRMPAGTKLICTGAFDNSPQNPANPDPTKLVHFGEQTFDEMFIGYLNYAELPQTNAAPAASAANDSATKQAAN
ncbi:MAG: redoxin domain-containing protein [Verrucomicrobia bacterium]|nr:redoxin domain-containing protein [Verrucomicrobiota bacterium]